MNILFVLGGMRIGGYEILNVRIANELVKRGIKTTILSLSFKKDMVDTVSEGVELYFLRRKFKLDFTIIYKIYKLLKHIKPNVIISCDYLEYLLPRFAMKFLRHKPVPLFAFHATKPPRKKDHISNKIFSILDKIYKDDKIVIHKSQIDYYANNYHISKNNFHLIYNGVNIKDFNVSKDREYYKDGNINLVHIASLKPLKDQWTLLKVMVELNKTVNNWKLNIAGADVVGLQKKYEEFVIQKGLESKINFLGKVQDVKYLLAESDLFLLTSITEALPLSIIEAGAMRVPAIVTNVGGCPEIISDGVEGYIVDVGDYKAIAEKVKFLYNHPILLKEMGIKAREKVEKKFSFNTMMANYIALFEEIAN